MYEPRDFGKHPISKMAVGWCQDVVEIQQRLQRGSQCPRFRLAAKLEYPELHRICGCWAQFKFARALGMFIACPRAQEGFKINRVEIHRVCPVQYFWA